MKAVSASQQVSARDLSRLFMCLFTVVHLTYYASPQEPSPSDGIFLESLTYTASLLKLVNWNVDRYGGIGWFNKSSHPIWRRNLCSMMLEKKNTCSRSLRIHLLHNELQTMKDKKIKLVQFLPLLARAKARPVTISNLATSTHERKPGMSSLLTPSSLFMWYFRRGRVQEDFFYRVWTPVRGST